MEVMSDEATFCNATYYEPSPLSTVEPQIKCKINPKRDVQMPTEHGLTECETESRLCVWHGCIIVLRVPALRRAVAAVPVATGEPRP